jgi:carbonic anhydrase/acetyltransferase-like protein (isoleucine patch superfamily)
MQSIDPSVWIAPGVQIYGKVAIAEHASLWPNAVIRAEAQSVRIGRYSNVQDFAMIHVGYDDPTTIGEFCSITHHATIHGATIGDHCLVGIGATIMDGAVIGKGSIVGGGALVPEGKVFPPGVVIVGIPAKVIAERDASRENRLNAWMYQRNAAAYRAGDHRAWDGPAYRAFLEAKRAEIDADLDLKG